MLEPIISHQQVSPEPAPQEFAEKSLEGSSTDYLHFLWITVVLAGLAFCAGLVVEQGDGLFAASSIGILIATIELVGFWSVFGTGGYLWRLAISHLAGLIVFGSFGIGLLITTSFNQYGPTTDEFLSTARLSLLMIPPLSVAVQLPLWFFRAVFGWQFVARGRKPGLSFTLREIFTLTFVIALAFATPQVFSRLAVEGGVQFRQAQFQPMLVEVVNDDGSVGEAWETEAQIEKRLDKFDRDMERMYLGSVLSSSVVFFVITIIAVPVLLFMFRPREPAIGCLISFFYSFAICLFFMSLVFLMGGTLPDEVFGLVGAAVVTAIGAGAVALLVTRSEGFELTSPKRFERKLAVANEAKPVEAR